MRFRKVVPVEPPPRPPQFNLFIIAEDEDGTEVCRYALDQTMAAGDHLVVRNIDLRIELTP